MFKVLLITIIFGVVNLSQSGYYEILGVSKQATSQEIRQAYKKLAIKFHPDKSSDEEDQKKFIEITEAYETLKDPEKRKKYDLYGAFPSYSRKYDYRSQAEYNNLFYNGLYHDDPNVETLSGRSFYNYLSDGFHFVNFYSPFCPPCQNLAEDWKKLAEIYKDIVKVGAVNCKYHNSFCFNSMRIGSYPTLVFYSNGKTGNYQQYRGERTFEALDQFLMSHLRSRVHVPVVTQIKNNHAPIAYTLGSKRIDNNALTRIAYLLKNLVTLVIVEDESLREKLTKDEYTTIVFTYGGNKAEIKSTEEKEILQDIVNALPKTELVDPEKLKEIRTKLRSGYKKPWVLHFTSKEHDRLLFYQMKQTFPEMHFGEVDCDTWSSLCASLQATPPGWGILKRGGAFQRSHGRLDNFLRLAPTAVSLHSLSAADLKRILAGDDTSTWVLVVVPHHLPWSNLEETFTRVSLRFLQSKDISFGIMSCTPTSERLCEQVASDEAVILVQQGKQRHEYRGQIEEDIVEFIQLLLDREDVELDENSVLEILEPGLRQHSWLVAFFPAQCGPRCAVYAHEWRRVAHKLRPLEFIRLGVLQCKDSTSFCANIRTPTAGLYPIASGQHYTISLQQRPEAPYIWEWALGILDDSVQKLMWHTFTRLVISEDLVINSNKKPWLIYFHSPGCDRCYEMYADFAMAGIFLNNAVQLGKLNCISGRSLCQHEQIAVYPSLRLYVPRTPTRGFSRVFNIELKDYETLLREIKPLLVEEDNEDNVASVNLGVGSFHVKHDEF